MIWSEFSALQSRLVGCVERSDGLDLRRVKVASPVSRLVRVSLGAWFAALIVHEQNHIAQAGRVYHHPNFPNHA